MTIGERIREIRKAKGMTQSELAGRLGITPALIGHYERGERNPKNKQLDKIADALEVPWLYLMGFGHNGIFSDGLDKISERWRENESYFAAYKGLINILSDIYGGFEERTIEGKYDRGTCMIFGTGDKAFILESEEIDVLLESVRGAIKPVVEFLTDGQVLEDELKIRFAHLDDLENYKELSEKLGFPLLLAERDKYLADNYGDLAHIANALSERKDGDSE